MDNGFAHVGLATHNMASTIDFYCRLLGCRILGDERIEIGSGGEVRQVSIDVGRDQYIVFMQSVGVQGIPDDFETSINAPLGLPAGMYHISLSVRTLDELTAKANTLTGHGVKVSEVTDLGIAKSVFLADPNGIQIELSVRIRAFDASDVGRVTRAEVAKRN